MHSAIQEFTQWSNVTGNRGKAHVITTNIEHCATELPVKNWAHQGLIGKTCLLSRTKLQPDFWNIPMVQIIAARYIISHFNM